MASDDDIEKLKAQNFEEPIKHDDEVGPVGNLFGSCVQILQALSTKARELDTASRKNHHPDGPQRSESANESCSAQSRKEGRVRKMAKSGCVTCRKRKKMCDEGKPECNNCVRDGFICDGYIVKLTRQKPEAPNINSSEQGTETFLKSGQSLPLDGAVSQLLVKTLESNLATLIFWDDEFGALSGHLDKALEHSEENRDLTLATLISLADFLSHDLLNATLPLPAYPDDIRQKSNIHARIDKARGIIMDTEAPNREETRDIQDVCEILDSKVARLNVLGPILEDSIPSGAAFEQVAAHGQLDDRPAHQYYADQISIRFPNASASLVEVLGKCNWERYMRIHKKREENIEREGSPIGETENMSKFHDSGLGTSVPAYSAFGVPRGSLTYAETVVSKRAEASHRRLPLLPEEGRKGWPFLCEVCNSVVRIRRTGAWKKHIFSDVFAYVCVFEDCPSDRCFFEDRDGLTAHLGNQHGFAPAWKSEICPLCLEETGDGMNTISMHFTRHMEEVALGAIPRTVESDADSDESSSEASSRESGDRITLREGLSYNGKPAELVREENGKMIPITELSAPNETFKRPLEEDDNDEDEDAIHRSMARRRNADRPGDILHICADCKKEFKRPCDLTKHQKTHSRLWKCPEAKCKYHDLGWPTEKERDRHVNDKHTTNPPQYKCLFAPCGYASKRESNCKQHMEKAHGWTYVGSKANSKVSLKCPITTCEYHHKGFASKHDQQRHTLTHYKGTMVCGFCPGSGSAAEKSFNHVDVFRRHLISVHGIELAEYTSTTAAGTCSTCSVTFANAQDFDLHLDACILRVIQQADPAETINQTLLSGIADDEDVKETLDRNLLPNDVTEYTNDHADDEEKDSHQPSQDDLLQQSEEDYSGHDAPKPLSEAEEEPDTEITRCACGYQTNDGTYVQCDVCKTWQHLLCYYEDEVQVPETHICVECQPRPFDQARIKKRHEAFSNTIEPKQAATTLLTENHSALNPFDPFDDFDSLTTQPQGSAPYQASQSHPALVDIGRMAAHKVMEQAVQGKPRFPCPHQTCDYSAISFDTKDELEAHVKDTHAKVEDPLKFAIDAVNERLGLNLDETQKPLLKQRKAKDDDESSQSDKDKKNARGRMRRPLTFDPSKGRRRIRESEL